MNRFLNRPFIALLAWTFPPPLFSLVATLALLNGLRHPWLAAAAIASAVLSLLLAVYAAGLCTVLHESLQSKQRELENTNGSFLALRKMYDHLTKTMENLTGMREIQVSARLESFSDKLRNVLGTVHAATEARSLTIYIESHRGSGAFPKAHLRRDPHGVGFSGEIFIFLDEELPLESLAQKGLFNADRLVMSSPGEIHGLLLAGDRVAGSLVFRSFHAEPLDAAACETLRARLAEYALPTQGVVECWNTRRVSTLDKPESAYASVPIISERLTIGVLLAEFAVPLQERESFWSEMHARHMDTLREFGCNIGQPIKREELYEMAIKDGLTGLFNKAHFEMQLNDHFHRMQRYKRDLSLIQMDIDHFKSVNDKYGHLMGDQVLKGVARILSDNVRRSDIAFRVGGEEMCVLLVETSIGEALGVAEKLRAILERAEFPLKNNGQLKVTASFGVADLNSGARRPEDLIEMADAALYRAKAAGRNRVETAVAAAAEPAADARATLPDDPTAATAATEVSPPAAS